MKTNGKIYRELIKILKEFEDTGDLWIVTDRLQELVGTVDEIVELKAEIKMLKNELDRMSVENAGLRYSAQQQLQEYNKVRQELECKRAAIEYWAQEWKESKETKDAK